MKEKRLRLLGLFGVVSLISYSMMVFLSPLAYPGYDWMTMAVSLLSAEGSPSRELANSLNAFFAPAGLVSITAVWIKAGKNKGKAFKGGITSFLLMEWACAVGYALFPWNNMKPSSSFQNVMHLFVTMAVVVLSLLSLVLIAMGGKKAGLPSLGVWAIVALIAMMAGPVGTFLLPPSVFGLFERFSTFSAVVFNAVLGMYLFLGKLEVNDTRQNDS